MKVFITMMNKYYWVNTNLKLRMTIIDAANNLIINEEVIDSE